MTDSPAVHAGRTSHLAADAPIAFLWGAALGVTDVLVAARDGVWSAANVARAALVGALALILVARQVGPAGSARTQAERAAAGVEPALRRSGG